MLHLGFVDWAAYRLLSQTQETIKMENEILSLISYQTLIVAIFLMPEAYTQQIDVTTRV